MNSIEMIQNVRDSVHEHNTDFLSDKDIISFLNKGQRNAQNILSRVYEEFFHTEYFIDIVANKEKYLVPDEVLAVRIQKVDILSGDYYYNIKRTSLNNISNADHQGISSYPEFYFLQGKTLRLFPKPSISIGEGLRIFYSKRYPEIGLSEGRVEETTTTSIIVDSFTTDKSGMRSLGAGDYINVVDSAYGKLRGTYLVSSIDVLTNKITIFSGFGPFSIDIVDIVEKYFGFVPSDFSNLKVGDTLVVSGSVGNDGNYVINLVDDLNNRLYVAETIKSGVVGGNGSINIGNYKGLEISTILNQVHKKDIITKASTKGVSDLPICYHDYPVQYAIVESLKKAKEPIEEAFLELKSLGEELRKTWNDRISHEEVFVYRED